MKIGSDVEVKLPRLRGPRLTSSTVHGRHDGSPAGRLKKGSGRRLRNEVTSRELQSDVKIDFALARPGQLQKDEGTT